MYLLRRTRTLGEGALIAMHGSIMGIGTDIGKVHIMGVQPFSLSICFGPGGSTRLPAAVNGVYGIRPSHARLAFSGIRELVRPHHLACDVFTHRQGA